MRVYGTNDARKGKVCEERKLEGRKGGGWEVPIGKRKEEKGRGRGEGKWGGEMGRRNGEGKWGGEMGRGMGRGNGEGREEEG